MKKLSFLLSALLSVIICVVIGAGFDVSPLYCVPVGLALAILPNAPAGSLGFNNTNNVSARMSFDIAKDIFYKSWINSFGNNVAKAKNYVDNLKLSQGEIRLEVGLNTTNNTFTFAVNPNQANSTNVTFPTEQRLNLQDSLVVSEYGIFLADATSNTDTVFSLFTYGNLTAFPTGGTPLDQNFYSNGYFQLKVNNDTIIPYRGLFNHQYRPQTQQTAAAGAGSPLDQLRGSEDGFITMEPNALIIGSKNYVPQIVLPSALSAVDAGTRAVLIMRGVLAQNSTVVN